MIVRAVAVALALAGCTREPAPRPEVGNRGAAVDAGADAAVAGACVEACVRDRQMVAMSPEAIRAACVDECARQP